MAKQKQTFRLIGATLALSLVLGGTTFAGPYIARPIRSQQPVSGGTPASQDSTTNSTATGSGGTGTNNGDTSTGTQTTATVKTRLLARQLKTCQIRSDVINTIMKRSSDRAQNQIALFAGVATKVENFYTSKGKTISNYNQLTSAVTSAEAQANTDLATLKANGTFSCSANDPSGVVSTYRTDLKTERSDLQALRTAVRNLILGVAKAEGVTLSKSAAEGTQQ